MLKKNSELLSVESKSLLFEPLIVFLLKIEDFIESLRMAFLFPSYIFTVSHKFFQPLYSRAILWIFPVTVNCCFGERNTNEFLFFEIVLFPKFPISARTYSFGMESALLHLFVLFLVLNFLEFILGLLFRFHQEGLLFHPSHAFTLRVY